VLIPGGFFQMGVPQAESRREKEDDNDARPVHPVRIGRQIEPAYRTRHQLAATRPCAT
jgi:formylglycine-generating enzyme required for sulfatase activity